MKLKSLKKTLLNAAAILFLTLLTGAERPPKVPLSDTPVYLNTSYSFDERAADLVSRLTLEEKEGLLGNNMAAVPRLEIKPYNVWSEALHGVMHFGNPASGLAGPTSFPNSVALGAAWDPDLIRREAAAIADEARAINATGAKGLTFWSPVVEPVRDPRWGRTGETYGEDPFLVSQIAGGFVRGMMGHVPGYLKTVPCAKHYFANNSEFDRHVSSSDMDSRDMREFYLAPYKKLIEEDDLPSIMSSYNAVNGVPTSASRYYLDTIARRTYGMKGYVTGDCAAVEDIYTGHYYVETAEQATAEGLKAGVDIDCGSVYQRHAISALEQGLITMADIDRALLNIFTIRMRTGEFDPPAKVPYALYQPNVVNSPAHQALAREIATKTPVLLKNEVAASTGRNALPVLLSEGGTIAVLGPQADEVELGPYSGRPDRSVMISPLEGIRNYISENGLETEILHSSGGNTASKSNLLYVAGFELQKSDGTLTRYDATKYSAASDGITTGSGMGSVEQVRTIDDGSWTAYNDIDLANVDTIGLIVNIPTEGGIVELRVGSPDGNLVGTLNATAAAGAPVGGVYGAGSMMKVKVNRLGLNEPQTLFLCYKAPDDAPIDQETIDMAGKADVALVFVGTDEKTATEEADRLTLLLPGNQVELIKSVAAANPNTIVVMQTLGCVEVEAFRDVENIPGILWVGYNGQAQGAAMADILFGKVNPGGKLNATWYKSVDDLPPITDYTLRGGPDKNGRTFWYFDKEVSYEFGFGLSYTEFEYSNFRISRDRITPDDQVVVSVDVRNSGAYDGDEVVQVYMTTPESPASLQRPIKRLKGFRRITIPKGQSRTVHIPIDCADLWFWDLQEDRITYDDGKYVFEIGASSKDIRGNVEATMNGAFTPVLKTVVAGCGTVVMAGGQTAPISLTAAMSDDTFYDVSRALVSYSSNNPSVATVDVAGVVTAVTAGVATITASVTIEGRTASGSFPVKVMPDLKPASILVNNKAIRGYDPDVAQYSFLSKKPASTAPRVEAKQVDPSLVVQTVQAQGIPGTASVTVLDPVTVDKNEYTVNFGIRSVSDDFGTAEPGGHWKWERENPAGWSMTEKPGSLVITSGEGDITDSNNNAENLLLQSANTDWTIESSITCSRRPSGFTENAGILAYQDDDNFVKLVYRASFGRRAFRRGGTGDRPGSVELLIEQGGVQKSSATLNMEGIVSDDHSLVLKLVKEGDRYTAYVSSDGAGFETVGTGNVVLRDIQAGLMACDGVLPARFANFRRFAGQQDDEPEPPLQVAFDYFRIRNSGL